jgi:hypothetical protein
VRRSFHDDVDEAFTTAAPALVVTESDLAPLPAPVQKYLRATGAVGRRRVTNMRVRMHGRIRSGVAAPWMPFVAEQYSFFQKPARFFFMKASRWLIPIHVYHRYAGTKATMNVKVFDQLPITSASGPDMTRAETVTMFNDMCVLAPATLIDPGIQWEAVDQHRARAAFTNAGHTIRAELLFNDSGELIDFRSDDRLRTEADGSMKALPWSTPMHEYREFGHVRIGSRGEGVWHEPGGPFAYVEIEIDSVEYNVAQR